MRRRPLAFVLGLVLALGPVAVEASAGSAAGPSGTSTVLVTMREQAVVSSPRGAGRAEAVTKTIRTLKSIARTSQTQIRRRLDSWSEQGLVTRVTPLWITNALSVTATDAVIAQLATRADVASVTSDRITLTPATGVEPNIGVVKAPGVWNQGYRGKGVVVASLDSGVDVSHPDLAGQWRGGVNSWFDPYNQHPTTPTDLTGHGTATMGVMVGGSAGGTAIGVAPGAKWIAAKIFNDQGSATLTALHQAFQWVLDPDQDPTTDDAPQVVNGSWSIGTGPGCDLSFQPDVQALRAAGIVPVFAAGNYGPGASTSVSPANYPESLSVGAVTNNDAIYSGSSRGPSTCGGRTRVFPDLVAPGVGIKTTDRYGQYQSASGTSVAAPHVAGALALLLGASPGLPPGSPESAMTSSVVDLGVAGPDDTFGAGRLDVLAGFAVLDAMPGFRLFLSQADVVVQSGGAADVAASLAEVNGFSGSVDVTASALPSSVGTAVLDATTMLDGDIANLHIDVAADAPSGTYPVVVSGVSGTSVYRTLLEVRIPPRDFALTASPSTRTVSAGAATWFRIGFDPLGGFTGVVRLRGSGVPPDATATWSRKRLSGTRHSRLTVATSVTTPPGTYRLVIRGRSGSVRHRTAVTLIVT